MSRQLDLYTLIFIKNQLDSDQDNNIRNPGYINLCSLIEKAELELSGNNFEEWYREGIKDGTIHKPGWLSSWKYQGKEYTTEQLSKIYKSLKK